MNTLSYKTVSANKNTVTKEWVLIDAENQVLGRLASAAAFLLRGKHKTNFTPHKEYIRHTGYPGGQRRTTAREMMKKKPTAMVEKAIKGMLPKNRLGAEMFRNLKVYAGSEHNHEAQKPRKININEIR